MELRLTFNEDEYNYEKYRPGYPTELFQDIFSYSQIGPNCEALEIGIGTGQASLPFIKTGANLTGIELGSNLSKFTAKKYSQH